MPTTTTLQKNIDAVLKNYDACVVRALAALRIESTAQPDPARLSVSDLESKKQVAARQALAELGRSLPEIVRTDAESYISAKPSRPGLLPFRFLLQSLMTGRKAISGINAAAVEAHMIGHHSTRGVLRAKVLDARSAFTNLYGVDSSIKTIFEDSDRDGRTSGAALMLVQEIKELTKIISGQLDSLEHPAKSGFARWWLLYAAIALMCGGSFLVVYRYDVHSSGHATPPPTAQVTPAGPTVGPAISPATEPEKQSPTRPAGEQFAWISKYRDALLQLASLLGIVFAVLAAIGRFVGRVRQSFRGQKGLKPLWGALDGLAKELGQLSDKDHHESTPAAKAG